MGYFSDDSGNFENLVKIWTRRPPNYHQNASRNTRKIMESSWQNIMFVNMGHQKFRKFSKSVCPRYQICSTLFDFVLGFSGVFLSIYISKYFYEDEELKTIHFPLLNSTPTWIWISFFSKKHEMEITLNFVFSRNVP